LAALGTNVLSPKTQTMLWSQAEYSI
jgi:hypothetical protein